MEQLLQYVWKYKLYISDNLTTTDGASVTIIDRGIQNTHAGPDFFNAKIKIDDTVWAGCIEVHTKASDWLKHSHHIDKSYDNVILHVIQTEDIQVTRTNGEKIPQLILQIPETVQKNIDWLLYRDNYFACFNRLGEIDSIHITAWLNALESERLERKSTDILNLLEQYNDWNEVFYIILSRNFGFGINSDSFERLARSLPFRYIQKQRGSCSQVEALLFGQAGMLSEENSCEYYRLLQQEYKFLKNKYRLTPLDKSIYKNLRTRPHNFPPLKIAQLAAIWMKYDTLFSLILETENIKRLKSFFSVAPSFYWENHFHFKHTSSQKENKILGDHGLNILLINTVAPMLFAYGKHMDQPEFCDRSLSLLASLPPEKNTIIQTFNQAGLKACHAGETQALIQLKKEYCEKKKCLYCRIGFLLLKNTRDIKGM